MTMSFCEMPPMPGSLNPSPADLRRIFTFCSAIARSRCWTAPSSEASISPFLISPDLVFPSQAQTGTFCWTGCALAAAAGAAIVFSLRARRHRGTRCRGARAGGEHVAQLVRIGAARHSLVDGDRAPLDQRGQGLVERLHPELRLAHLHRRVDLMDLVLANEVPDGGVGHHHFDGEHAARAARLADQVLRDHALEHEAELRANLRLLVGREDVEDAV